LNGTGSFQSDLTVYGNLKVWGTQSIINSTNVELSDNIIYLAPSGGGDFDLGIVGHYNDGTYSHTGIFSDASDGHAWKVFKGLSAETTGAFIDTNGVGFTLADFKANNIYGGIYATNGIISGSSQLTASFDTRYALSGSGGSTTIPVGTISGSSQLTASFDARYLNTGGDGVISGSSQITSFGFVSGSYETTGRGIISSSTNLVTTSSFNSYTASISTASLVTSITNLNTFSSSTNIKFSTLGNLTGSFATTGSNVFVGTETISGSLILSSSVPTSTTGGAGDRAGQIAIDGNYIYYNTTTYVPEVAYTYTTISGSGANPSWTNQLYGATTLWIAYWGSFTGSAPVPTAGLTLSDGTNTRVITSVTSNATGFGPSYILNFASSINWSTLPTITAISQSAINANWVKVPFNAITASTMVAGTISGSSQLTSSFDTRYTLSGSVQPLPSGLISGSSQLTASLDTRYAASGSVGGATPAGTISGSSQLTSSFDGRYLVTGSVTSSINQLNIFTASVSTASLVTSITNLNSTTASLLIETSNLETFSSSILSRFTTLSSYTASVNQTTASLNTFTSSINVWTSSIATTGSNSFNGAQTITGSLTVSSVAVVSASVTLPSGSILSLTSGSNLVIQNNGIAEITGSLKVSGSTILTGSITISSGSITMPDRPAFRVVGAGGTKAATTVISGSYMVADFSQGSGWNQSTGTFTAPIAGLYQVNIVARCAGNSNPSAQVIVYKNNTTTSPSPDGTAQIMLEWAANTTANHIGGSTITKLAVGDTLKAVVALGTISFDANDNFSVAYIG
jgi:hypothetical protein